MDVEGTDGRERGEKEVAFEKKTSLFSLALAEVLIVNMWMNDIGRNNAANLPLLRTVFEINLQLFQHEKRSRTLLLFVVRDHVRQATPLEKLVQIIEKDLRDIWSGIQKPEKFKNTAVTDLFDFQYVSLPHKMLEADKFKEELSALSLRFNDASSPGYIWSKMLKSSIPADGFALFAQRIWETILENKDLDLPSQREILATFRCDEIAAAAHSVFQEKVHLDLLPMLANKQVVADFGAKCDALLNEALTSYSETATHYLPEIVDKKRDQLLTSLLKVRRVTKFCSCCSWFLLWQDLKDLWNTVLALLLEAATRDFEAALQKSFARTGKDSTPDFGATVKTLKAEHGSKFAALVACSVPKRASWGFALAAEQLEAAMDTAVEHEREKQLKKVMDEAQSIVTQFGEQLEDLIELGRPKMWTDIRALFAEAAGQGKMQELRGKLETLNVSPEEIAAKLAEVGEKKLLLTRKKFEQSGDRVVQRMEKVFDAVFKLDEAGVPRVWKPESDLQAIYSAAVEAGAKVLELFTVLRLEEEDDQLVFMDESVKIPPEKMLLSRAKANAILAQYKAHAAAACADAQRAMEQYGKASAVPTIMFVLIVLLGWNEFMYLLSNPMMLVLLITMASAVYAVHMLGMTPVVLPVVTAAYNQAHTMAANAVAGLLNPPPPRPQSGAPAAQAARAKPKKE